MGLAKTGKTHGLTGTGMGLACQDTLGQVVEQVWNQTEIFFQSTPGLLADYADPLRIVDTSTESCCSG